MIGIGLVPGERPAWEYQLRISVSPSSLDYPGAVFWVFMLRHKILKSKFKRPAKLLISLGVR